MERLVSAIEANPDQQLVRISMAGIEMLDGSFASEAIVELIRRYMGKKGICLVDFEDSEGIFNLDLAARNVGVPVAIWDGKTIKMVGGEPSPGNREALAYALSLPKAKAAEFAEQSKANISIANASTKFKQLWEQGFLMRSEGAADSGGVEFEYRRIG